MLLQLTSVFFVQFDLRLLLGRLLGEPSIDLLSDSYHIPFSQAQRAESSRFQIGQDSFIDPVTVEGRGVASTVVHIASCLEEERKPVESRFARLGHLQSCSGDRRRFRSNLTLHRAGRLGCRLTVCAASEGYVVIVYLGCSCLSRFVPLDHLHVIRWYLIDWHLDNHAVELVQADFIAVQTEILRFNLELACLVTPNPSTTGVRLCDTRQILLPAISRYTYSADCSQVAAQEQLVPCCSASLRRQLWRFAQTVAC